ncbi:30S ribosome-binding factor RbfA [Nonomuraea sp. NPDC046570]|uniref:30S ribosome-binding factor RbfA n=1 Tax=Nonomuraea sp. NPDC046570 TaxID=3155255 RepID=UPI0033DB0B6E
MVDAARARKLADRIQQIVAEMLERRVKDPRLGFVTVTDTRITNDLREATVFYTVFGSEAERGDTAAALESAKGIIRSEVGRQTGVRHTPTLTFQHDPLPDSARQLDQLLAVAKAKDAEVAAKAAGAQYAGDADPYKKPDVDEDEDEPSDRAGHPAT